MMLEEAIARACAEVGIEPPKGHIVMRRWINTDTLGKHGKGDGRIICDEERATAWNWQTGDKATVWLKEQRTDVDRKRYAQDTAAAERRTRERADAAAAVAHELLAAAEIGPHPYLARKGFPDEAVPVIHRAVVTTILLAHRKKPESLMDEGGEQAIVLAARRGRDVTSVQLIWERGAKKFLAGGDMDCVSHRIATGRDTWLCEGFATGLSLRTALQGLRRSDTILVCFSASNIAKVAATIKGHCYIAADNDKPLDHFGGLGTGEHYAQKSGRPYIIPPDLGMDINDMHRRASIFDVQRLIGDLVRRAA